MSEQSSPSSPAEVVGRGIRNVWVWAALGLVGMLCFSLGGEPGAPRSPFWFLELVLVGVFLVGLFLSSRGAHSCRCRLRPGVAGLAYVVLAWCAGMTYELTLSESAGNIGGCGPTTALSFLLAQFAYLPIFWLSLGAIRCYRLGIADAFFFGGAVSFAESLVFRPMLLLVIVSPQFFLAPFVLGYYVLVYGIFVAIPLLVIDERDLWSEHVRTRPSAAKLAGLGTLAGFAAAFLFGLGGVLVEWMMG